MTQVLPHNFIPDADCDFATYMFDDPRVYYQRIDGEWHKMWNGKQCDETDYSSITREVSTTTV